MGGTQSTDNDPARYVAPATSSRILRRSLGCEINAPREGNAVIVIPVFVNPDENGEVRIVARATTSKAISKLTNGINLLWFKFTNENKENDYSVCRLVAYMLENMFRLMMDGADYQSIKNITDGSLYRSFQTELRAGGREFDVPEASPETDTTGNTMRAINSLISVVYTSEEAISEAMEKLRETSEIASKQKLNRQQRLWAVTQVASDPGKGYDVYAVVIHATQEEVKNILNIFGTSILKELSLTSVKDAAQQFVLDNIEPLQSALAREESAWATKEEKWNELQAKKAQKESDKQAETDDSKKQPLETELASINKEMEPLLQSKNEIDSLKERIRIHKNNIVYKLSHDSVYKELTEKLHKYAGSSLFDSEKEMIVQSIDWREVYKDLKKTTGETGETPDDDTSKRMFDGQLIRAALIGYQKHLDDVLTRFQSDGAAQKLLITVPPVADFGKFDAKKVFRIDTRPSPQSNFIQSVRKNVGAFMRSGRVEGNGQFRAAQVLAWAGIATAAGLGAKLLWQKHEDKIKSGLSSMFGSLGRSRKKDRYAFRELILVITSLRELREKLEVVLGSRRSTKKRILNAFDEAITKLSDVAEKLNDESSSGSDEAKSEDFDLTNLDTSLEESPDESGM